MDEAPRKRCTYCGREHSRRARACSDYCERKTAAWRAAVTAGRTRARVRILAQMQAKIRHRTRWRAVAMGHDREANLLRIFNIDELP